MEELLGAGGRRRRGSGRGGGGRCSWRSRRDGASGLGGEIEVEVEMFELFGVRGQASHLAVKTGERGALSARRACMRGGSARPRGDGRGRRGSRGGR